MRALHAVEYITSFAEEIMRWKGRVSLLFVPNNLRRITAAITSSSGAYKIECLIFRGRISYVSLSFCFSLCFSLFFFVVVPPLFLSSILFPPFFMRHKLKYRRVYISYDFKSAVVRAENGFLSRVLEIRKKRFRVIPRIQRKNLKPATESIPRSLWDRYQADGITQKFSRIVRRALP